MKALLKSSTSLSLQPDVFFILVSGKTGTALGGPVKYNINGEGKVIGPQVHITSRGAIYILFGFGKMHLPLQHFTLLRKHSVYLNGPDHPWDIFTVPSAVKARSRGHENKSHCHGVEKCRSTNTSASLECLGFSQRHIMPGKFHL